MWAITPEEMVAIKLSLRVATVAMLVSLPFGILVAYVLSRGRFAGKILLDGLVHMPLVLPPVVTGYALLVLFGRRGTFGAFPGADVRPRARRSAGRAPPSPPPS